MKVEFYRHNISSSDIQRANHTLRSLFLTTGAEVANFERAFSKYLGIEHAIGVTSCTASLHLALTAFGIRKGDEVITTPLSFVATAHAIEYVGARPVFVDVENNTGNIDATKIEHAITRKTRAIIPVHLYGQLCDMLTIRKIANKHRLVIIEDAAHAIEARRNNYRSGSLGDAACFSFYATKNITSGEGGMIVVHSQEKANLLKKLRNTGLSITAADRYTKMYRHYDVDLLGWKYNMDNIRASLLIGQLKHIDRLLKRREQISQYYDRIFNGIIDRPSITSSSRPARHLYTIWVDSEKRDAILRSLQKKGIGVAVNFRPIHLFQYYRNKYGYRPGDFPVAEHIGASTISIPLYPKLTQSEMRYITRAVLLVARDISKNSHGFRDIRKVSKS